MPQASANPADSLIKRMFAPVFYIRRRRAAEQKNETVS